MLHEQTAKALHLGFISGQYSAKEIAQDYISHIQKHEEQVGAFLSFDPDDFLKQAQKLDEKKANHEPLGPLAGVPVAVKDNIHIRGRKQLALRRCLKTLSHLLMQLLLSTLNNQIV